MFRAMRYAGLADARLYADWMLAFDPIEADIPLEWPDLAAPGIKPVMLRRPILNVFSDKHPRVRYNEGRDYYRNSFAPVAVFDKEGDRQNRLGAMPLLFQGKHALRRTLVVYNDEFTGGDAIAVNWAAEAVAPETGVASVLQRGKFTIPVPYGEKREEQLKFNLPERVEAGRWLNLVLIASKSGVERFNETNRLGALLSEPAPKPVVSPRVIDLGEVGPDAANQWHTIRLVNAGGGASLPWKLSGDGEGIRFNLTAGNLRAEQEIYFQVAAESLPATAHSREIRIAGTGGTSDTVTIRFKLTKP